MSEIGSQSATWHAPAPDADGPRADAGAWDLVTVPARQGLEAVDILRRGAVPAVGPVVHDGACDTLGFLVPPGTAAAWDMPGSACTRTSGRGLRLPELPELPEPHGRRAPPGRIGCCRRGTPTPSPTPPSSGRRSARRPASSRRPTAATGKRTPPPARRAGPSRLPG